MQSASPRLREPRARQGEKELTHWKHARARRQFHQKMNDERLERLPINWAATAQWNACETSHRGISFRIVSCLCPVGNVRRRCPKENSEGFHRPGGLRCHNVGFWNMTSPLLSFSKLATENFPIRGGCSP